MQIVFFSEICLLWYFLFSIQTLSSTKQSNKIAATAGRLHKNLLLRNPSFLQSFSLCSEMGCLHSQVPHLWISYHFEHVGFCMQNETTFLPQKYPQVLWSFHAGGAGSQLNSPQVSLNTQTVGAAVKSKYLFSWLLKQSSVKIPTRLHS